jgi:hypothetical protein
VSFASVTVQLAHARLTVARLAAFATTQAARRSRPAAARRLAPCPAFSCPGAEGDPPPLRDRSKSGSAQAHDWPRSFRMWGSAEDRGDRSGRRRRLPGLYPGAREGRSPIVLQERKEAYGRSTSGDHSRVARPVKKGSRRSVSIAPPKVGRGTDCPRRTTQGELAAHWYQFCICDIVSMLCMSIHGVCMFTEPAFLQRTTWPRKRRRQRRPPRRPPRRWQRRLQRKRNSRIHD